MKLTVLVDNNTLTDNYLQGEPGLSFFIEDDEEKILFDVGYSDLFKKNATTLGIDLTELDYIVLSHGHDDHCGGLKTLLQENFSKEVKLVAHPSVFYKKYDEENLPIGMNVSQEKLSKKMHLNLTDKPIMISEKLMFLGEIPRKNSFEGKGTKWTILVDGNKKTDYLLDDSALVYKADDGIVIITGCSHSGIVNVVDYAKKMTNCKRIKAIIGGLHLKNDNTTIIDKTISHLVNEEIEKFYPSHCTGLMAKIALSKAFFIEEVGVGLKIVF